MSNHAILRRNSSKAGLQTLMKVTAQRSIEDAEEVERERRRRARESFRRTHSGGPGGEGPQDNGSLAEEDNSSTYDSSLKTGSSPSLEEDEGFSDWTQRREKRRQQQQRLQELSQEPEDDHKVLLNGGGEQTSSSTRGGGGGGGGGGLQEDKTPSATPATSSSTRLRRQHKGQEESEKTRTSSARRKELEEEEEEEVAFRAEQATREKEREEKMMEEQRRTAKKMEELQKSQAEVEKRKEVKVSYTSKVFLQQEAKPSSTAGSHRDAAREDMMTSCNDNKSKRASSTRAAVEPEEAVVEAAALETEQRLEKIRRSHQEKESQELEQLRHRQAEAEQELEELKRRREERRRLRQDEERRREEEDQHRLVKEEDEKRRMKEDIEKRRQEAAERMKILGSSSVDGEEMMLSAFSPKSPVLKIGNEEALTAERTCSITERTQSLNRSLKKSNSFKKTHPPVLLTKIDDKREQYTHAVENSQEAKAVKQGVMDIPSGPELVSSKKNLFEGGEVWSQSPTKGPSCKDTEDLKVGVADLITQWVKGNPEGTGKQSPSRPADVKPGDVMNKKNMWEIISDTSGRTGQRTIGTTAGKKYKFVVTGHGKYEKKPAADGENGEQYPNGKSDLCQDDY